MAEYQTPEFHPAFEEYCEAIWELKEDEVDVIQARVAERLHVSRPAVSEMIKRMQAEGFVSLDGNAINLTDDGLRLAEQVVRRHRLAERLLTDVIGLEWDLVHDEACRWEHVISTDVERRLVAILGGPTLSPYGNPIPALDELGAEPAAERFLDGAEPLSDRLRDGLRSHTVVIRRLSEVVQADLTALKLIADAGIRPEMPIEAALHGPDLVLTAEGRCVLPSTLADHIFVATG